MISEDARLEFRMGVSGREMPLSVYQNLNEVSEAFSIAFRSYLHARHGKSVLERSPRDSG